MEDIELKPDPMRLNLIILEPQHSLYENPAHWRGNVRYHVWRPPTDVFEIEDTVVVRVEIPGVKEDDFSIILDGRSLSIQGTRPDVPERRAFHQMEIRFGEFISNVELPFLVDAERIDAVYNFGFLRIMLPRAHPKVVKVDE